MKSVTLVAGMLALCASVALVVPARAVTFDGKPKIMVHALPVTTKNFCAYGSLNDCTSAVVAKGLSVPNVGPYYYVYLACAEGSPTGPLQNMGVSGIECGIDYQNGLATGVDDGIGIDIFGWSKCADLEFITPTPVWPNPGGGTLLTWNCTTYKETSVAGYFYVAAYSADTFSIIPRPVSGFMKVADCPDGAEINLATADGGKVAFSAGATTAGCNPCNQLCGPIPVQETTWGSIKHLYSR
jgi:hypothetical protein